MEGVASGNPDIDKFIKDTMYAKDGRFPEWVPYERFTDIKEIGEGGFAKVFSATWIDGESRYDKQSDGSCKKREPYSKKVALKRLNGSQNMSDKYLNELKIQWKVTKFGGLNFFGLTKDLETKEFMMIIQFAEEGNLRNFGLSGSANEQKSDDKVYGVMPYIAPEVLNGEQYTSSADIYSFGVVMAEISSGKPPFYNKNHDLSLALAICSGLRPEFGKGTPEFYKKLAYKCMNANSNERPTAGELYNIFVFWCNSNKGKKDEEENFGYKGEEIRAAFEEADKEIPNISTLYKKNSDAVYTSRAFTFSNLLPKPVNSSIITSYINEENNKDCDSQLVDLEVSNSIKLRDTTVDENSDD
ncbi:Pkh1p [Rhizophagus irregularis DAOM 197198w]|uniref:Pkh1p n=2 Tax=Rhizophagus irregularis TaxID=588596 RepID=A0A015NGL0_RHIIW|nr:Pkh1p [Rhizophagus irregularis DAOM 197198w]